MSEPKFYEPLTFYDDLYAVGFVTFIDKRLLRVSTDLLVVDISR